MVVPAHITPAGFARRQRTTTAQGHISCGGMARARDTPPEDETRDRV